MFTDRPEMTCPHCGRKPVHYATSASLREQLCPKCRGRLDGSAGRVLRAKTPPTYAVEHVRGKGRRKPGWYVQWLRDFVPNTERKNRRRRAQHRRQQQVERRGPLAPENPTAPLSTAVGKAVDES